MSSHSARSFPAPSLTGVHRSEELIDSEDVYLTHTHHFAEVTWSALNEMFYNMALRCNLFIAGYERGYTSGLNGERYILPSLMEVPQIRDFFICIRMMGYVIETVWCLMYIMKNAV